MKNLLESILDYTENPDGSVISYAKIGTYEYNDLDPYIQPNSYKGPWKQPFVQAAVDYLKSNYPDIDNYLVPTDKEIAHIYNAKQKVEEKYGNWGVSYKAGININSISDLSKAIHYFLVALAIDFPGYVRRVWDGYGSFPKRLFLSLGVVLWDSPVLQDIKNRLSQVLEGEKIKDEKRAERAAKRQEKQAEISTDYGKFNSDSPLFDISFSAFKEDNFDDIIKSGNDVHIKSLDKQTTTSDRRSTPGKFVSAEIVFNEGKKNEYKTTVTAYSISGNEEGPVVYSSKEFRNLPNRQFNNWVNRKLNQLNSVTIDADDTETESLKESADDFEYERRLLDRLKSDCDYVLGAFKDNDCSFDSVQKHFWAGNAGNQILKMRELYDLLPDELKPKNLNKEKIDEYEAKFTEWSKKEESLQKPTNTKINIRESLNSFDIKTNNRYDLRNSYDSAIMTKDDKIKLAKMISLGESYSNIAKYIEKFI